MHLRVERSSLPLADKGEVSPRVRRMIPGPLICSKMVFKEHRQRRCDKAIAGRRVMLHLRFCYVSKAAILTVPVHVVPTENRSPA
jgi:hypothetical protein